MYVIYPGLSNVCNMPTLNSSQSFKLNSTPHTLSYTSHCVLLTPSHSVLNLLPQFYSSNSILLLQTPSYSFKLFHTPSCSFKLHPSQSHFVISFTLHPTLLTSSYFFHSILLLHTRTPSYYFKLNPTLLHSALLDHIPSYLLHASSFLYTFHSSIVPSFTLYPTFLLPKIFFYMYPEQIYASQFGFTTYLLNASTKIFSNLK